VGLDAKDRYIRFAQFGPNSADSTGRAGRLARVADVASAELGNVREPLRVPARRVISPTRPRRLPVFYLQDGFNVFQNPAAPFGSGTRN